MPRFLFAAAVELLRDVPTAELIWASPRELLNNLSEYSLDTVKLFYGDAQKAGVCL